MKKNTNKETLISLVLGVCPVLILTNTLESGIIASLSFFIIFFLSSITMSIIKKAVPEKQKISLSLIVMANYTVLFGILLSYISKDIYEMLGIYLPLLAVNYLIVHRIINISLKESFGKNIKEIFKTGISFVLIMITVSIIREVIGTGMITVMDKLSSLTGYKAIYKIYEMENILPMNIFKNPAGALLTLAFIVVIINYIKEKRGVLNESK
jgi:Predicted NADH:ubiquinone oxidoreductase, subunit RnfE